MLHLFGIMISFEAEVKSSLVNLLTKFLAGESVREDLTFCIQAFLANCEEVKDLAVSQIQNTKERVDSFAESTQNLVYPFLSEYAQKAIDRFKWVISCFLVAYSVFRSIPLKG